MRRFIIALSLGTLLALFGALAATADDAALTDAEFADLLVRSVGITLPAGSLDLPAAEYYEVIANYFAARGITYFTTAAADSPLTYADMASVLYVMVGGTGADSVEGMIDFLTANGYMPPADPAALVSMSSALEILGNPAFSAAVAEAYRAPAGGGDRAGGDAPGVTSETVASQI